MKSGVVALIGRPNAGKSTLLNNVLGQKVSITSPRPQTTRFAIQAVFNDDRGQIVFVDTPGIFARTPDPLSRKINLEASRTLSEGVDVVVYVIDHTRTRDTEENKTLGLIRRVTVPKILAINKSDVTHPDFSADYAFYEDEFNDMIRISALSKTNLHLLLEKIFAALPEGTPLVSDMNLTQPGLNLSSKLFISELIREKAFLNLRDEVPYTINAEVDEITERSNSTLYVKGRLITIADRYKKMVIGRSGRMIKEIGTAVRKELEAATGNRVFVDLTVEVDPHWQETF